MDKWLILESDVKKLDESLSSEYLHPFNIYVYAAKSNAHTLFMYILFLRQ